MNAIKQFIADIKSVKFTRYLPPPQALPPPPPITRRDLFRLQDEVRRIADEMHTCAHTFTKPTRKAVDVWAHDLYEALNCNGVGNL